MSPAATIDDGAGTDDGRACMLCHFHGFASRACRRDHILNDKDLVLRREAEAAAQCQPSLVSLRERRPHVQGAADLLTDHDPSERWREHAGGAPGADARPQRGADGFGIARMLQDERALQVAGAVQTRGEPEMSFQQRAGTAKQAQEVGFSHRAVV